MCVPGGVCTIAFSIRMRPICRTRSSSPSAIAASAPSRSSSWPLVTTRGPNSVASSSPSAARSMLSTATLSRPASSFDRSSRSVASLVRRVTWLRIAAMKSVARLGVELLAREQLEEAREREQRRSQLVGGVGDELRAGAVERGEPHPHAVERARELPELVRVGVDDRRVELAVGDARRGRVETADAPREQRRERRSRARARTPWRARRRRAPACARRPRDVRSFLQRRREHHDDELRERVRGLGIAAHRCASPFPSPCTATAARACTTDSGRPPTGAIRSSTMSTPGRLPRGGLESERR